MFQFLFMVVLNFIITFVFITVFVNELNKIIVKFALIQNNDVIVFNTFYNYGIKRVNFFVVALIELS
jgi:hypothetical protein